MAFFDWVAEIDISLFRSLNDLHTPMADGFWWMVSDKIAWLALYVAILALIILNKGRESIIILLMLALTVVFADQFSGLIKDLVGRLRPSRDPSIMYDVHIVNGYRGGLYSFVSSHAANSFGVAVFASLLVRNFWLSLTLFLWAGMNAYSRIYLGVHFPLDVIIGGLLGGVVGWLIFMAYSFLIDKMPAFSSIGSERSITNYTRTGYRKSSVYLVITVFILSLFFFWNGSVYLIDFMS